MLIELEAPLKVCGKYLFDLSDAYIKAIFMDNIRI